MASVITFTLIYSGTMLRYDPGVMADAVLNQSQLYHHFELVPGEPLTNYVALIDCEWLGKEVYIEWPDGTWTRHYVGDCAQQAHLKRRRKRNTPVEVSFAVAKQHCIQKGRYCLPLDGPLPGVRVWERNDNVEHRPY